MTDTAMIQQTASVFFAPGTIAELRIIDTPVGLSVDTLTTHRRLPRPHSNGAGKRPPCIARSIPVIPRCSPAR